MVRGLLRWAVFALSAAGVLAAGGLPASPSREPEWVQKAEALARLAVSQGKTAGLSLFVRKRGRTWISGGYGEADLENHVAASPDTVYSIASITKQFTAAAIVQLVEAGKLGLDVQIEKYLPEYPPPGNRVTVRQLLNHTSGIRSMTSLGARYWSQIAKDVTPQETILLFENEPLDFEPGQRYAYNNSGYVLLGALIERVTGSSYSEYLAKQIFLAAGLERTSYCATRAPIPPRAHGYSHGKAGLVNARYFSPTQGFAVGGICSTAPDLGKWLEALTTGRVVSPAGFTRMTTPEPAVLPDGETLTYGFGTGVGQFEGHPVLYHAGGIFGFDAMEAYYPRDDLTVVVLCNTDGDTAGDLENAVTRLALQIPPPPDRLVPADLESACVGAYRLGDDLVQVRRRGNRLSIEMPGEPATPLLYREKESFSLGTGPVVARFVVQKGSAGEIRFTHYGAPLFVARRDRRRESGQDSPR